jgi:hypothetical protein
VLETPRSGRGQVQILPLRPAFLTTEAVTPLRRDASLQRRLRIPSNAILDDIPIQTRAPKGRDPGAVETGYYVFVEGSVILTDERGRPIGRDGTKQFIGLDGHHRNVACMMLRQRTRSIARSRSFNRPIQYAKSGWC